MKKRALSMLLAVLAVLSLCAPALAEAPEDTPAPTPGPTETAVPTFEPTVTPDETTSPTLEPTEFPVETAVPTAEPTEAPAETIPPTLESTAAPEETTVPTTEPTTGPEPTPDPTLEPEPTPDSNAAPDPNGEIMTITEAGTITLNRSEITTKSARTVILRATFEPYPPVGQQVEWTSSDPSVIEFDSSTTPTVARTDLQGRFTVVGPGTAEITVSCEGYEDAVCQVEVIQDNITTWGKSPDFITGMTADQIMALDVFDPRDLGLVTDVNEQNSGICVAEGHIGSMEASMLRQGLLPPQSSGLDELNLSYHFFNYNGDPLGNTNNDKRSNSGWINGPLRSTQVPCLMTTWDGPVAADASSTDDGFANCVAKPEDILYVDKNVETIKQMIATYGAVVFEYRTPPRDMLYHYISRISGDNHCSVIVGWDDSVQREDFANLYGEMPKEGGAWIVKNSWGESAHSEGKGYFYLSYESFCWNHIVYKMMPKDTYDFNYFYDGTIAAKDEMTSVSAGSGGWLAASYQAKRGDAQEGMDEYLKAVNVGVSQGCTIQVEVYTNVAESDLNSGKWGDQLVHPVNGTHQSAASTTRTVSCGGFYTIPLARPVQLEEGQYFTVAVQLSNGGVYAVSEQFYDNKTFITTGDGTWWDTANGHGTLRLKAFTKLEPEGKYPLATATPEPTATPSPSPSPSPTPDPTASPTPVPTATPAPSASPTPVPTAGPTMEPTDAPSPPPTATAGHQATSEPYYTPTPPAGAVDATAVPEATAAATPGPSDTAAPVATATAAPVPVSPTGAPAVPATGDGTPLALYAWLLTLCAAGLTPALHAKRRTR